MASRHKTLCAAVAADLAAASFSQEIVAAFALLPDTTTEHIHAGPVLVRVVPGPATRGPNVSRDSVQKTYAVDVGVIAPTNADETTAQNLLGLLEEIEDHLEDHALDDCGHAEWLRSSTIPGAEAGYSPGKLRQSHEFWGIVRLIYGWDRP